jgi:putative addiction module killer protein
MYSFDYTAGMITVKTLPQFDIWLNSLKDHVTRIRLSRRIDKAQRGNLGDIKPVGKCVFEMREHFGPGWRMYYFQRDNVLIVMLGGGDKTTQSADITKAIKLSTTLED